MADIIVALPALEDSRKLGKLMEKNGYHVSAFCETGSKVLLWTNRLDGGIVICGYKLSDMHYTELIDNLSLDYKVLLLASPGKFSEITDDRVTYLPMPFKVSDLFESIETVLMDFSGRLKKKNRLKKRSAEEKIKIEKAKQVIMSRHNMSENQAHHYIQKISMDSGVNMVESAEKILELLGKEWES